MCKLDHSAEYDHKSTQFANAKKSLKALELQKRASYSSGKHNFAINVQLNNIGLEEKL